MKTSHSICLLVFLAGAVGVARAEVALSAEQKAQLQEANVKTAQQEDFASKFNFGAGVAYVSTVNGARPVKSAKLDAGNILRVEQKSGDRVGVILENHWLFGAEGAATGKPGTQWRHGIFVCTELGEEKALRSFGLGYMASFRSFTLKEAGGLQVDKSHGFNLGLGILADPSVQVLGDGLKANQPLPAGDTIRFREKTQLAVAVIFSAGF